MKVIAGLQYKTIAQDEWNESDHLCGQPENAGRILFFGWRRD